MRSDGGAKRWWDDYLVRYFMPTIAGVAIVIWLGDIAGKDFQELLLLPKTTSKINTSTLILLLLYGNLFCYVASYPILSFHATRVLDFKGSTWRRSCLDGYKATTVLSLAVLLISFCFPIGWRYYLAFLLTIAFSGIQLRRICKGLKPKFVFQGLRKDVSPVYDYAYAVAKRRSFLEETTSEDLTNDKRRNMQWRGELMETYRHLREHGNSGFIFLLELTLAGLIYCILVNNAHSESRQLSEIGILLALWAFPAVYVHLVAQHLERSFTHYELWWEAGDEAD